MTRLVSRPLATTALVLMLVAGACGKGGGAGQGVASLSGDGDSSSDQSTKDGGATEEEVLAWVECMRGEGIQVPDPTVDDDGNLVLGAGPVVVADGTDDTGDGQNAQPLDGDKFRAATEECGDPPRAGGAFTEEDRQAFQDAALEMARCLRGEGLDVPDPDFSDQGPGGPPETGDGTDSSGAQGEVRRGPFGDLDPSDPKVEAAFDKCQAELGDSFPGPGGLVRGSSSDTSK